MQDTQIYNNGECGLLPTHASTSRQGREYFSLLNGKTNRRTKIAKHEATGKKQPEPNRAKRMV